jgi:hypothetical protein
MPRWSSSILVCGVVSLVGPFATAGEKLQFNRDIRPILSNNCYLCHGPDEKHREGGLRLDRVGDATAKLESGVAAIVPGDVNASELVKRILSTDPNMVMPPPNSGKTITDEQRQTLKQWVAEGAEYQGHWSFISPQRPTPPAVKRMDLVRNDIDPFLLSRLEKDGIEPNGEADKVTLIRSISPGCRQRLRKSMRSSPTLHPKPTDGSWIDCSTHRDMENISDASGWMPHDMATRMVCTSTTNGRCGRIANG